MTRPNREFDAMHKIMCAWGERQKLAGWQSPEVEKHATRVVLYLWECAHNHPPSPSALEGLAEETRALARAKATPVMET